MDYNHVIIYLYRYKLPHKEDNFLTVELKQENAWIRNNYHIYL